jgi:sugar phosphate isomerase/epimerase
MVENLFAALPYGVLNEHLGFFLDYDLQPEIAFTAVDLERLNPAALAPLGRRLAAHGRRVTVHAPFHDLNPGALDPGVRDVTVRRFCQAMAAAESLGAGLIVFHPGYEKWKYGLQPQLWLNASLEFWAPFLSLAAAQNCRIAVENIFEDKPDTLVDLVTAIDSPWFGHCLDVGHWNLFCGMDLEGWIRPFAPRLFHLHLHDNSGSADEHLPVGDGAIDFCALFELLSRYGATPSMTMEAFSRENLLRSRKALVPFLST